MEITPQSPSPKPSRVHIGPIILIILSLTAFILASIIYLTRSTPPPLLSPLAQIANPVADILGINPKHPEKIIYGFLPFWNMNESDNFNYHLLTHVAYFGLDYNPDGTIHKISDDNTLEPGWNQLNSSQANQVFRSTKSARGKTIIVMRAMTQKLIESLVNNPDHRQQVIDSTMEILDQKNFDGINIDFEYVGTPDTQTKNNFSLLVKQLSSVCKQTRPGCEVSIDVFADSAVKNRIWDYASITPHIDYVIIMAYDFFRSSSSQAGPVAPLRGACSESSSDQSTCLEYDVAQTIADFSKIIPAEKIILGVPYYGYQWQTTTSEFFSNTYQKTGATATYKRIQELLTSSTQEDNSTILGLSTHWNDTTLTPWITYTDTEGNIQQIHYEDERSLSLKYDLVNQSNIAGIAIWALGYDGNWPQLWQLLQHKFLK